MVSGLYDLPGLSATAIAAAWANRLEAPMTKVSKVYFGLSRASVSRRGRASSGSLKVPGSRCPSLSGLPPMRAPLSLWLSR